MLVVALFVTLFVGWIWLLMRADADPEKQEAWDENYHNK